MGTNYYLHCEKIDASMRLLHIGKKSVGWKFVWKGYQNLETEIKWTVFLRMMLNISDDFVIKDEYGYIVSLGEFIEMIERSKEEKLESDGNFIFGEFC